MNKIIFIFISFTLSNFFFVTFAKDVTNNVTIPFSTQSLSKINNIFPTNFLQKNNWIFIFESNNFCVWNTFYIQNILVFVFTYSYLLLSFSIILNARRSVEAIFGFLSYLLVILIPFFSFESDYIGAVHLLVYPGAILIFFTFATLTTEQRGHWQEWQSSANFFVNKDYMINRCAGLIFTSIFIYFWWTLLSNGLKGSVTIQKFINIDLMWEWNNYEKSTSLIALGTEIFNRRLISLALLGFLLTLSFMGSLNLLSMDKETNRFRNLFPKLGMVIIVIPYLTFHDFFGSDAYFLPMLNILGLGIFSLVQKRYAFIHSFLILEALGLSVNVLFALVSAFNDTIDGEVLLLFIVAIAAAETAIGLAIFLRLSTGNTINQVSLSENKSKKIIFLSIQLKLCF